MHREALRPSMLAIALRATSACARTPAVGLDIAVSSDDRPHARNSRMSAPSGCAAELDLSCVLPAFWTRNDGASLIRG